MPKVHLKGVQIYQPFQRTPSGGSPFFTYYFLIVAEGTKRQEAQRGFIVRAHHLGLRGHRHQRIMLYEYSTSSYFLSPFNSKLVVVV